MKSNNKLPKWLEYLDASPYNIWFTPELLSEFDRQLKPQFEKYFQRPMNWERLWLFVEPVPEEYYLKYVETDEGFKTTRLKAKIKCGQMPIDCIIGWWSKKENNYIHPSTKDIPDDLEIVLEWINEETTFKRKFPGLEDKSEMNKMDIESTFEVFIDGKHLTHEGYMEIYLLDSSDESRVRDILSESLAQWNNHENAIEKAPEDRGFFHQLDFEEMDGKKMKYYLDCGSAVVGAHEFLMENLSRHFKGVEKVIFKPI